MRTVDADLSPAELGPISCHEHVFQAAPLLPGGEMAGPHADARELADLPRTGFRAVVDAMPLGLGRRAALLPGVAPRAGVHLMATTGRHREAHDGDLPGWCHPGAVDLTGILLCELTEGMAVHDEGYLSKPLATVETAHTRQGPVRAEVLKAGIGHWSISVVKGATLEAVAAAHRATDAPVLVDTERCTAPHEVLDLLSDHGLSESRACLAHADGNPDTGLHTELTERGAYLRHDGAGRAEDGPDSVLLECLAEIAAAGRADRVPSGNDVARRSRYRAYRGMPERAYPGERVVPRVRQRLGATRTDRILTNPGRWPAWVSAPTDVNAGRRSTTSSQGSTPCDE